MLTTAMVVTALLLSLGTARMEDPPTCPPEICDVDDDGTIIDIVDTIFGRVDPGLWRPTDPDNPGDPINVGWPGGPGTPGTPPLTLCNTEDDTFPINDPLQGYCPPTAPGEDPIVIPYPTLYDLASFAPNPPTLTGEPLTAGIMGKPTNFLSSASEHTLTGELFTYPVSVLFTPVNYTFDYGDGSTLTATDASTSWQDDGLPQFSPTGSSHTYSAKGMYSTSVTVAYSAQVNFSGSSAWLPVAGYVYSTTSGYDVTIYEALTALVDKDCNENPTGEGCP